MKKTYQTPNTVAVLMKAQPMMAGSLGDGDNPRSFTPGSEAPTTTTTSGNLSRRRSLWDDED
jgi:hypothetical protein